MVAIDLLNVTDSFIDDPPPPVSSSVKNLSIWLECRVTVRDTVYEKLDAVTYSILRNVEKEMDYIDLETMSFKLFNDYLKFFLWTTLEKASPDDKTDQQQQMQQQQMLQQQQTTCCNFEECSVTVQLPKCLFSGQSVTIDRRQMYLDEVRLLFDRLSVRLGRCRK